MGGDGTWSCVVKFQRIEEALPMMFLASTFQ
jgi:hypothetical protein